MGENRLSLILNAEQRLHLFGLLLVYLFGFRVLAGVSLPQDAREHVQEVVYRLLHGNEGEREGMTVALSVQEIEAIKEALAMLQPQYEQEPRFAETSKLALEHLAICRALIEEAEQRAQRESE